MPAEEYILSLSYGKDSMACLRAIELLGWPLDRIITADVWATDTIPADPPPMVEFKDYADEEIKRRWGIEVEHICARNKAGEKQTYEKLFYHVPVRKKADGFQDGTIAGFPYTKGAWCNDRLKTNAIDAITLAGGSLEAEQSQASPTSTMPWCNGSLKARALQGVPANQGELVQQRPQTKVFSKSAIVQGAKTNIVQYFGIAADEPNRIARHTKTGVRLPLVEIGWEESFCGLWCQCAGLLSPVYTTATRGGLLVLPQSRRRPTAKATADVPRLLGTAFEMGC